MALGYVKSCDGTTRRNKGVDLCPNLWHCSREEQ